MASDAELKKYMKLLAMIGGIVGLIESIIGFFFSWSIIYIWIAGPIIGIVLSVLVLLSVYRPGNPIPYKGIFLLIFGIIMLIITPAVIGGVLVLVAGILGLIAKS
jgi:hypothetical protein